MLKSRDTDILRDGIMPPSRYEEFDMDMDGGGYGGSYASRDANMTDHICVWVQSDKTPMKMEETINRIRTEEITFILKPDTEFKLVNNYTEEGSYHDSEGLVKGPLDINPQNIELVIIAKANIRDDYEDEDAIPPQSFWEKHIGKVKTELERRGIDVYLTRELPEW